MRRATARKKFGDPSSGSYEKISGHHSLVFNAIDIDYGALTPGIGCSLPTWTLTHGSIRHWHATKENNEVRILIPRFWWNILFVWLPKGQKIKSFFMVPVPNEQAFLFFKKTIYVFLSQMSTFLS